MQQTNDDYQQTEDFELNGEHRKTHVQPSIITIATDDNDTAPADLRGYGLIGLIVPVIDAANLTFYVSEIEGGTYRQLYTAGGAAVTVTGGTGDFAVSASALAGLGAYRWVKIHTSAVQTANRTFKWVLKA